MLEDLVSPEGAALYQRLVARGGMPLSPSEHEALDPGDSRVVELLRLGLAFEVAQTKRLLPTAPVAAFEQVLTSKEREFTAGLTALNRAYRELENLQRTYARNQARDESHQLARVITDTAEIATWANDLRLAACHEFLSLNPPHPSLPPKDMAFEPPPSGRVQQGVRFRVIYDRGFLEHPLVVNHTTPTGEEARFTPDLGVQLRIADGHTALIALEPGGSNAALLVHAPYLIAALRLLFELLWQRAEPLEGPTAANELTDTQLGVLRLLATGLKDEAIARALRISVKTVRRHVAALLDRTGTDTRFAAGVEATRRGWIGP